MREYLENKGVVYDGYAGLAAGGANLIDSFLNVYNDFDAMEKQKKEEKENKTNKVIIEEPCKFECDEVQDKKKKRKRKQKKPEFIMIFDDMSGLLRHPSVQKLLKNSRHYKTKIIIASQGITDLHPEELAQLDYLALFKNFSDKKLEFLYERLQLHLPMEKFIDLYKYVTSQTFDKGFNSFILINLPFEKFYINLDTEIKPQDINHIEKEEEKK
jgi:hypothetical protein